MDSENKISYVLPKDRADRAHVPIAHIHPLLVTQRFVVLDDVMYVLYPLPTTYCSDHIELKRRERNVHNVMMHLCGKDHMGQSHISAKRLHG